MRLSESVKTIARLMIALLLVSFLTSCGSEKMVTDSRIAMGTLVIVSLPESDEEAMDGIFSLIYEIDHKLSRYNPSSWISRINQAAGEESVSLPEDIYALVKASVEMAFFTDGIFNPAIGPLSALWGMGTESAGVPDGEEINEVLPLLDYSLIELVDENCSVYLPLEGMALDLGGVGKGYAADCVRKYLEEAGVKSALVNLGGNVLAYGHKSNGEDWRIGIRDPEKSESSFFTTVDVADETVITSGSYQRYIEQDGMRYHHILDSQTGYPAETDILSATVIGASGTLGDMLSTTLFALGSEKAMEMADRLGIKVVLYLSDGSVLSSDGHDSQIAVLEE